MAEWMISPAAGGWAGAAWEQNLLASGCFGPLRQTRNRVFKTRLRDCAL